MLDSFLNLRPILSAINTGTYKWSIFVPLLKSFSSIDNRVNNSSDFTKDISRYSSTLFMISLDIEYYFANMPLDKTINICVRATPVRNYSK